MANDIIIPFTRRTLPIPGQGLDRQDHLHLPQDGVEGEAVDVEEADEEVDTKGEINSNRTLPLAFA